MTELPRLEDYASADLERASQWPAIARYRHLLSRASLANGNKDQIRLDRHKEWLRCALATCLETASAEDVCRHWSLVADQLILEAWKKSGCEAAGFALLALGKLGSRELNLSSDVDLIAVRSDASAPELKQLREFQNLLSDTTEFGHCLRVDFTLRPGGRSSAAIPSASEFEYHYGYHGEMWERLAYVRMRILAGPKELVDEIGEFSRKFSYRKHLDYTLLDELKALRTKIRSEKFETRPGSFHLKLGEGGIRELELFVHALQVLHGGRNTVLQTTSTGDALERIKELQLLPAEECDFLRGAYWRLRTLENRLQGYEDLQNYDVDLVRGEPCLPDGFQSGLEADRLRVSKIATSLFGSVEKKPSLAGAEDQAAWLRQLGFSESSCQETWPALLAATALSRRSEADERARLAFLHGFVTKLSEIDLDRDLGLSLLLDFVRAVRAKASFFTLLNRISNVRDDLARLFSISPYLGSLLSSRPELIDEFIFRKQAEPPADFNALLEELAERRLLAELIAGNHFLADRDLRKMSFNLTANADAICTTLLERLKLEVGASDIGLVPMGKWGGRELGLKSDLDFIFITPSVPTQIDHKIARRFLSRITEPHRGGSIYAIDMRLRPSGSAGPIMVQVPELQRYIQTEAAAWERQAYLRSRVLPGSTQPPLDPGFHPARFAGERGLSPADIEELKKIRLQLFGKATSDELDLKLSIGGLADVEFTAQIALLAKGEFSLDPSTSGMIQYLESLDEKWKRAGQAILKGYETLRTVEQLFQLTTSQSGSRIRVKSDEFKRLALVMRTSPSELESQLRSQFNDLSAALSEVRVVES